MIDMTIDMTDMILIFAFFGALNALIVNYYVDPEIPQKLKLTPLYFNAYIFFLWPMFFAAYIYLAIIGASTHEN